MTTDQPEPTGVTPRKAPDRARGATAREDRLKAALKANMARRKAQAKARQGGVGNDSADDTAETGH